jgi:endo-1,4-beta-xylanase
MAATKAAPAAAKPQQGRTLRDAYKNYFPVGVAVNTEPGSDIFENPAKLDLIKTQYSSISPRFCLQPLRVHPKNGVYNFDKADQLVAFAKANNMKVRGHCLMFSIHMGKWFFLDGTAPASRDVVLARMKDHITTVMNHYKDSPVYCWDVVNEAINNKDDGPLIASTDLFNQAVGPDYVQKAFEYARAANPNVKLFYNDGIYTESKRARVYQLVKGLKDKGLIDGVGLQLHLGREGIDRSFLQSTIDMFSKIGLEVQFTEVDVSIYDKVSRKNGKQLQDESDAYTDDVQNIQANNYDEVFSLARQNKGKVTGVTIWGDSDTDGDVWEKQFKKKNYMTLFGRDLQPKKVVNRLTSF